MMMAGSINFVGEHHCAQEREELSKKEHALWCFVSQWAPWLHVFVNARLGGAHPDNLYLVMDRVECAIVLWKKVAKNLNGSGTPEWIIDDWEQELLKMRDKLQTMEHICRVIWDTNHFLEQMEEGCPHARAKKSHVLLGLEDRQIDRHTPEFHVPYLQGLAHRVRNEDLLRETKRLANDDLPRETRRLQSEFRQSLSIIMENDAL